MKGGKEKLQISEKNAIPYIFKEKNLLPETENILIVVPNIYDSFILFSSFSFFYEESKVLHFPSLEIPPYSSSPPFPDILYQRMYVYEKLSEHQKGYIVVAPLEAIIYKTISKEKITKKIQVSKRQKVDMETLIEDLIKLGYERVHKVYQQGEFTAHGSIIDIFPINTEEPVRIIIDYEEISDIKIFSADTQLTKASIDNVEILATSELRYNDKSIFSIQNLGHSLIDLFPDLFVVLIGRENLETVWKNIYLDFQNFFTGIGDDVEIVEPKEFLKPLEEIYADIEVFEGYCEGCKKISSAPAPSFSKNTPFTNIQITLENYLKMKYKIVVSVDDEEELTKIKNSLSPLEEITKFKETEEKDWEKIKKYLEPSTITFIIANLFHGFEIPEEKLLFLTKRDLLGIKQFFEKKPRKVKSIPIHSILDLKQGDFVVHTRYGIGVFWGIKRENLLGKEKDYLVILYSSDPKGSKEIPSLENAEKLLLPIDQLNLITKYVGTGSPPIIDSLSGRTWQKRKKRVNENVLKFASELVKVHAIRKTVKREKYPEDDELMLEFERSFEYEETPDQRRAIEEVKRDMESEEVMDRLICGDVGFGKTEIAMRAAFKAVLAGKQVAILVPTTILAHQHLISFSQRFKNFPVRIEMLSRFQKKQKIKQILKELQEGKIDIIIGTHILLSKKVKFKNLGLLIIDEEHKFGVRQKELFRNIKPDVDILMLSATPIPRTLHMTLSNFKNISLVQTPPKGRRPVETYVLEYNEKIVKYAIEKELERGGQVLFIHNRIKDIYKVKEEVEKLVPNARIEVAHAKMHPTDLDRIFLKFIQGEIDILISTNIMESGINIPRVNTIIVNNAHTFGLADLYQLKGRVGRSDIQAYAYFLYPKSLPLPEQTIKRLSVINEYTELGVGFQIALKDLEIRGAGNILGKEQHGNIRSVGLYEYLKLLNKAVESIQKQKNFEELLEEDEEITVEIEGEMYIPDEYIPELESKIEIYFKLTNAKTEEELEKVFLEMIDRFGYPPPSLFSLKKYFLLKQYLKKYHIKKLVESTEHFTFYFSPKNTNINLQNLLNLVMKPTRYYRVILNPEKQDRIILEKQYEEIDFEEKINFLLEFIRKVFEASGGNPPPTR